MGKYWARWGDPLVEAGYEPNTLQGPRDEDDLLENLALLTRHLGHFPVANEIKLWGKTSPGFPSHSTFRRFGPKKDQLKRLAEFSKLRGHSDVREICEAELSQMADERFESQPDADGKTEQAIGYVYLLKAGRYFKVGQTNALGRRVYELGIQLPE